MSSAGAILVETSPGVYEAVTGKANASGDLAQNVTSGPPVQQELVDNTGTYLYEGYAPFGTATSATGWTIIRHTLSAGGISLSEVSDNNPNAEWDERAGTETYS